MSGFEDEDWSFFDNIRCINLHERTDRYNRVSRVFTSLSIPIVFYKTNKDARGGIRGCFESHKQVMREAYDQGCQNILIFEDDVENTINMTKANLNIIVKFLRSNSTWDIFFLGTIPDVLFSKTNAVPGFEKIYNMRSLGTHAYVASRRYMEKIINMKYVDIPIDVINSFNKNAYGIYPSMFIQISSPSDTGANSASDLSCLPLILKVIESYARYVNFPVIRLLVAFTASFFVLLVLYLINPPWRYVWLLLLVACFTAVLLITSKYIVCL